MRGSRSFVSGPKARSPPLSSYGCALSLTHLSDSGAQRPGYVRAMPILRIEYDGGPWRGTIGNRQIDPPSESSDEVKIYTSNPLIGYYAILPNRLLVAGGADYRASWIPAEG
jgi:hypothetical protein